MAMFVQAPIYCIYNYVVFGMLIEFQCNLVCESLKWTTLKIICFDNLSYHEHINWKTLPNLSSLLGFNLKFHVSSFYSINFLKWFKLDVDMNECPLNLDIHPTYYGIWCFGRSNVATKLSLLINSSKINQLRGLVRMWTWFGLGLILPWTFPSSLLNQVFLTTLNMIAFLF